MIVQKYNIPQTKSLIFKLIFVNKVYYTQIYFQAKQSNKQQRHIQFTSLQQSHTKHM